MSRPINCSQCDKLVSVGPRCYSCIAAARPKARKLFCNPSWTYHALGPKDKVMVSYRGRKIERELEFEAWKKKLDKLGAKTYT